LQLQLPAAVPHMAPALRRHEHSEPTTRNGPMSDASRPKRSYEDEHHDGARDMYMAASAASLPMPVTAPYAKRSRRGGTSTVLLPPPAPSPTDSFGGDSSWTKEDHRALVQAIYEVGLRHSSPSVIQEHMISCDDEQVTGERLKSHLQKYRKNIAKNRDDFLNEYDDWLEKALAVGTIGGDPFCSDNDGRGGLLYLQPPLVAAQLAGIGRTPLVGGEPAAFVTYSVMYEQTAAAAASTAASPTEIGGEAFQSRSQAVSIDLRHDLMMHPGESPPNPMAAHQEYAFPILTDEERRSPLGTCLSRVLGLFQPMSLMLLHERGKNQAMPSLLGAGAVEDDLTVD
jgi:SHAQKYF class myb-like DNA-binding protein